MVDTPAAVANCAEALKRSATANLLNTEVPVLGGCGELRFIGFKGFEGFEGSRSEFVQPNA